MLIGTWSLPAMWWSPENYRCHMKKQDINYQPMLCCFLHIYRADSSLAPSQWEMSLQSNAISHLRGANLESALYMFSDINYSSAGRWIFHATNMQSLIIIKSLRLGAVLVPLKKCDMHIVCISKEHFYQWITETKSQFVNFVITGGTISYHYDKLWCHQWQQSCQLYKLLFQYIEGKFLMFSNTCDIFKLHFFSSETCLSSEIHIMYRTTAWASTCKLVMKVMFV